MITVANKHSMWPDISTLEYMCLLLSDGILDSHEIKSIRNKKINHNKSELSPHHLVITRSSNAHHIIW